MGQYDNMKNMVEDVAKRVEAGRGCGSFLPDGWAAIVTALNNDIRMIDPQYTIDQIKEKFGGLRYYITLSDNELGPEIYKLVREAEELSMETCDVCGQPGHRKTQSRGGIATRCE
jgi:hypothetical protein